MQLHLFTEYYSASGNSGFLVEIWRLALKKNGGLTKPVGELVV
jgi:hypothetical protein